MFVMLAKRILSPLREIINVFFFNLTLDGPCIIFAIYIQSNETHNVVALIKFLLVLRFQLYMFRKVTVRNCRVETLVLIKT